MGDLLKGRVAIAPFAATRFMESSKVYEQHTAALGLEHQDRGIYKDYEKNGPWTIEELKDLLPKTVLTSDTRAPHII